jgi:hypothetical protein
MCNVASAIRRALTDQLDLSAAAVAHAEWLPLLAEAVQKAAKPLVVLLDQFEQFFVHHKRKKDREPFVHALGAWYRQQPPLPVTLLVCIRGDMTEHLLELQKAMGYTLGPHHNFPLAPFEPREAVEIFRVIAETEQLTCDPSFVEEMVTHELASRADGLVSPVDVQILAWMVKGHKQPEERGFTRTAYYKLGGIEGLLDQFLTRVLDARETASRREAALNVLLALTDLESNARAGVLTVDQLREKLAGTVATGELHEAVSWLARSDVRLITPVGRNGAQGYELAHERLIPALRRRAEKVLPSVEEANRLLERRVNEWLGNKRAARYLLTWRELRTIERQKPALVWGGKRDHKEALLARSKRRWQARIGAAALGVLLLGGGMGWYWNENHREHVEYYAQVITRRGLPEGVGRLSAAQVRQRNTSLAFHKRGRRGPVHEIRLVNSRGAYHPVTFHTNFLSLESLNPLPQEMVDGSYEAIAVSRVVFERDARGQILNQIAYNRADRRLYTLHYVHPTMAEYKHEGITQKRRESGIALLQFIRPEHGPEAGLDQEVRYFDGAGTPQPDHDGAYGVRYVFDARGLPVEEVALGADWQPAVTKAGIATTAITYDALGNLTQLTYLGRNGQGLLNEYGVAGMQLVYDPYGNLQELAYVGTEDQLVTMRHMGAAGRRFRYDARGNVVESSFFDLHRQPVTGRVGMHRNATVPAFARQTIEWDAHGRSTETYFGPDGKPIVIGDRVVKARSVWDARGYPVEIAAFDEHGRPIRNHSGCAKLRFTHDAHGNLVEYTCLDERDHPIRSTDGWARVTLVYDGRGNAIEASFFGPTGHPALYDEPYVKERRKYNAQGKQVEEAYFDATGQPVSNKAGYAKVTSTYDLQGNLTEIAFFDAQQQPTRRQGNYAKLVRRYDEYERLIEEAACDAQGHPTRSDDGYAIARFAYDTRGYQIATAYFDEHNQPTFHTDGYTKFLVQYNDKGQLVEQTYVGLDDTAVLHKEGNAKVRLTYNERGQVAQRAYLDTQDRPVQLVYGYAMKRYTYDDLGRETTPLFFDAHGNPVHTRVVLEKVEPNRTGAQRGLHVGDILVSYDGEDVRDVRTFRELELLKGERHRELRLLRQDQEVRLRVLPGRLTGLELEDSIPPALTKAGP